MQGNISRLACLCILLLSAFVQAAECTAERLSAEAQRILQNIKITEYSHKTSVDEEVGSYKLDCSGLLCLILKKVSPEALKAIPKLPSEKRQLAHDFYEHFKNAPTPEKVGDGQWMRIEKLADAKVGDVIAWKNENFQPGENTGHVMLVAEPPTADGENVFKVVVIDSSGKPHGNDTRKKGENGVGRGALWFSVDESGQPVGVRLSSKTGTLNKKDISIGRLK